jgi:hypothetical protein
VIDSVSTMGEKGLVEYRIEIAATFDMDIFSSV